MDFLFFEIGASKYKECMGSTIRFFQVASDTSTTHIVTIGTQSVYITFIVHSAYQIWEIYVIGEHAQSHVVA